MSVWYGETMSECTDGNGIERMWSDGSGEVGEKGIFEVM